MASDSPVKKFADRILERLQEQAWFQQLRAKWDELDPMAKLYTKLGVGAGSILLVFIFVLVSIFQVRSLKKELSAKTELKMVIQNASEELRSLKAKGGGNFGGDSSGNWQQAVKSAAGNAGIEEAALELGTEKPGEKKGISTETLVDVKTKRISIKQLVHYAVQIETGVTPVKLRRLSIDAEDPEGYLNATLSLSVFETKK